MSSLEKSGDRGHPSGDYSKDAPSQHSDGNKHQDALRDKLPSHTNDNPIRPLDAAHSTNGHIQEKNAQEVQATSDQPETTKPARFNRWSTGITKASITFGALHALSKLTSVEARAVPGELTRASEIPHVTTPDYGNGITHNTGSFIKNVPEISQHQSFDLEKELQSLGSQDMTITFPAKRVEELSKKDALPMPENAQGPVATDNPQGPVVTDNPQGPVVTDNPQRSYTKLDIDNAWYRGAATAIASESLAIALVTGTYSAYRTIVNRSRRAHMDRRGNARNDRNGLMNGEELRTMGREQITGTPNPRNEQVTNARSPNADGSGSDRTPLLTSHEQAFPITRPGPAHTREARTTEDDESI